MMNLVFPNFLGLMFRSNSDKVPITIGTYPPVNKLGVWQNHGLK